MRQLERILRRARWIALIGAALGLSAVTTAAIASVARTSAATTVTTHSSKLGKVLASANGHALYMFTHDSAGKSSCYASCASVWRPLSSIGHPPAAKGSGVNSKLLGTSRRKDGKLQVTYNGHPLYSYAGDTSAGQINGEGANHFGGRWYVISTGGNAVKPKKASGGVCNPLCPGY